MSQLSNKDLFIAMVPNFGANIPANAIQVHIDTYVLLSLTPLIGKTFVADLENCVSSSGANKPELYAFWNNYISKLVTYSAAAKWIIFHGQNPTQFGFSQISGSEFNVLTSKDRAVMSEDLLSYASAIQGDMIVFLNSVNWTFDGVAYQNTINQGVNQSTATGITAVKPRQTFPSRGY